MKKSIFVITTIMFAMGLQAYNPMLEEGNRWNELQILHDMGTYLPTKFHTTIKKIEGTKEVDNVTYYKLMRNAYEDTTKYHEFALLREDTLAQKVYANYDSAEYLLYDFDVKVGDTVEAYVCWILKRESKLIVDSIATIQDLAGNDCRKVILTSLDEEIRGEEIVWIEGYGSSRGIFYISYGTTGGGTQHLLCAYKDNEFMLQMNEGLYDGCFVWDEDYDNINSNEIVGVNSSAILFNSATQEVSIDLECDAMVYVYDMQGKLIIQQETTADENKISISAAYGVYGVVAVDSQGNRYTSKISL